MNNLEQICEKAIAIISLTHDGNDLSPEHLHLTECAVNGFLSDEGWRVFESIYEEVINGRYRQPWLQGIEHLTVDHEGYIYFKGHRVEHYDRPYALDNREDLEDLAARCQHLEQLGVELNVTNAIWHWERWKAFSPDSPWLELFKRNPSFWVSLESDQLLIYLRDAQVYVFKAGGDTVKEHKNIAAFLASQGICDDPDSDYHTAFNRAGFGALLNEQGWTFIELDCLLKHFKHYGVSPQVFEFA